MLPPCVWLELSSSEFPFLKGCPTAEIKRYVAVPAPVAVQINGYERGSEAGQDELTQCGRLAAPGRAYRSRGLTGRA